MTLCLMGLLILLIFQHELNAQAKKGKPKSALKTGNTDVNQWWIGVRGGTNLSVANPETSYYIFSYTGAATPGDNQKNYDAYNLPGLQFGFSASFEFIRGLSINLLPSYTSYAFQYSNSYRWYDSENSIKQVTTNHKIRTKLQYVELPMTIKYELTEGAFKPYLQAGGFAGLLTDANKTVETTGIDQASGSDQEIRVSELSVGIHDRTARWNYGIMAGIGFTQNVGNARIGFEFNYLYGLQNLDNGSRKYVDNQLISGIYDAPDDYSLNSIAISFQVIIPLKFITSRDYVPL